MYYTSDAVVNKTLVLFDHSFEGELMALCFKFGIIYTEYSCVVAGADDTGHAAA
jgi:hypothetical protein